MSDETEQDGSDESPAQQRDALGLGREFHLGYKAFLWTIRQLREQQDAGVPGQVVSYTQQTQNRPTTPRSGARVYESFAPDVGDRMDTVDD